MSFRILFLISISIFAANGCSAYSGTPDEQLTQAIYASDHKAVAELLKKGANPDALVSENDNTLLIHLTMYRNDFESFKLLIESGADFNAADPSREVPLTYASRNNQYEFVKLLVDKGADVNYINNNKVNSTALMEAAYIGSDRIVRLLLKNEADPDIVSKWNYSAISWAADADHFDCVKILAESGADPHIKGRDSNALDFAIHNKNSEMERYLRDLGVKPSK